MKVFIVYAHPEPKSFNGALFRTAQDVFREAGHEVQVSDLYAMGFNPVVSRKNYTTVKDPAYFKPQIEDMHATEAGGFAPDIEAEIRKMEWCDFMLWQHPLWWFGLPAILKGWVDRCFAMGRTYGGGKLYENGSSRARARCCRSRRAARQRPMRRAVSTATSTPCCAPSIGEFCNSPVSTCWRPTSFSHP